MSASPARVVVVDDSPTVRRLAEVVLRRAGCEVVTAGTAAEGLAAVRANPPAALVLDFSLPDGDGRGVCEALLADPATASVPVLLLSGDSAAIRGLYADCPNVRDYLTKPFQAEVLAALVQGLADRPAGPRAQPGPEPAAPPEAGEDAPATAPAELPPELRTALAGQLTDWAETLPERLRGPVRELAGADAFFGILAAALAASGGGSTGGGVPVSLVRLEDALLHLADTRATGRLELRHPRLGYTAWLHQGRLAASFLTPAKLDAAGLPLDFRSLPAEALGEAVLGHDEAGVPLLAGLAALDRLPPGTNLRALLRERGQRALDRARKAVGAVWSFSAERVLPSWLKAASLHRPVRAFLLATLRDGTDWAEIERLLPRTDVVAARTANGAAALAEAEPDAAEQAVAAAADGRRTVQELARALGQPLHRVSAAVYRLARLGALHLSIPPPVEDLEAELAAALAGALADSPTPPS